MPNDACMSRTTTLNEASDFIKPLQVHVKGNTWIVLFFKAQYVRFFLLLLNIQKLPEQCYIFC